jgi:hypothetical protein
MLNCIYVGIGLSGLAAMSFMSMLVVVGCVRSILFNIWLVKFDKFLEDNGIQECISQEKKALLIHKAVDNAYQKRLDENKLVNPTPKLEVELDDGPVILKLHG